MKQIKTNRIIQIFYPILVYFIVYQLGVALLIDIIGDKYGKLTCLLIAGIVCIIPMFIIFKSVPKLIPNKITDKNQIFRYVLWVVGVCIAGIVLNVILTQIGIAESSAGFAKAENTLSDGNLTIKLLCNCLVIPILEELLLRGIIAGQLYLWYGLVPSVFISSIFFGILHNNIVQFIYALVVGVLLGLMYVKNKRISLCIITHCLINFIVIIFS